MAWTERQHALLRGLGLRLWSAPVAEEGPAPAPLAVPEPLVALGAPAPPAAPAAPVSRAAAAPATPLAPGLGWQPLREAVAACRACSLCERRTQTVFGTGHEQASWLVVGEAPGAEEDLQGEPFVGDSGQLLDRMLAALSLTREADAALPRERQVYIANTLKCRPPGNRNPTPAELSTCEPFLVRQIELLKPRIILAMGRFAVQALLRSDEPIGKLRGRVHRYQGVPLVVTYHPAYLLRNLPEKAKAWDDLCFAAEVFEGRVPA
jgi:uracil-DNA glycosylase